MTNSISEVEDAASLLVIGSNTTVGHPIIGLKVKAAVRKGAKLIVANPREIDLCRWADIWLQHKPGTDVALLGGMMRVILDEGLADEAFIAERCENYEEFRNSLAEFDLDWVAKTTRVPKEQIVAAARLYAQNRPAMLLYTLGITQHTHGVDNVLSAANLTMMTGNIGKPSSGTNPLRGANNVQGACDMGGLPNVYPAYQAVTDGANKSKFEAAWSSTLDDKVGLTLLEIFDAAHAGKLKALYIMGENPAASDPDASHVREAIKHVDFVVVQDIFLTETAQLADVVLPSASFAEKDGTFTNTERRVQRVRKAVEPPGEAKPDWQIICELAKAMGKSGFDFTHPSEIMAEIARVAPSYGGISYDRLEAGGLQWPCPTPDHPGTPILHVGKFTRGLGKFTAVKYRPSAEDSDEAYPLLLTTGRSLFHFHTGTMTRKARGLNFVHKEEQVEINPADAELLGIANGDLVRVVSRRGQVEVKAKVTRRSAPGVVFMTFHFAETSANFLTNPAYDPVAKTPELKVCAVRVEKVAKPEPEPVAAGTERQA